MCNWEKCKPPSYTGLDYIFYEQALTRIHWHMVYSTGPDARNTKYWHRHTGPKVSVLFTNQPTERDTNKLQQANPKFWQEILQTLKAVVKVLPNLASCPVSKASVNEWAVQGLTMIGPGSDKKSHVYMTFCWWWDVYMMHGPLLIHGSAAALSIKELASFPEHQIYATRAF